MSSSSRIGWNVGQPLNQRVVADGLLGLFRRVTVWNHPEVFPGIQIDGCDPADRSLPNGQAIDGLRYSSGASTASTPATGCGNSGSDTSGAALGVSTTGSSASDPVHDRRPGLSRIIPRLTWSQQRSAATTVRRNEDDARNRICRRRACDVDSTGVSRTDPRTRRTFRVALVCGGIEEWREVISQLRLFERASLDLWRVVDQMCFSTALQIIRRGLGWKWLRGRQLLSGNLRLRNRTLLDRPDGVTRFPIQTRRGRPVLWPGICRESDDRLPSHP